jgi:hypothetical protein
MKSAEHRCRFASRFALLAFPSLRDETTSKLGCCVDHVMACQHSHRQRRAHILSLFTTPWQHALSHSYSRGTKVPIAGGGNAVESFVVIGLDMN